MNGNRKTRSKRACGCNICWQLIGHVDPERPAALLRLRDRLEGEDRELVENAAWLYDEIYMNALRERDE